MKLIDLHKEWCESGKLKKLGLCNELKEISGGSYRQLLMDVISPSFEEREALREKDMAVCYWGSGLKDYCGENEKRRKKEESGYTPLRQTIVLLICAMNNEL